MNKKISISLLRQIQSARKSRHITLAEMAQRIGSDQSRLSLIERGISSPTLDLLSRIAAELDSTLTLIPNTPTDNETPDPHTPDHDLHHDL